MCVCVCMYVCMYMYNALALPNTMFKFITVNALVC